MKFLQFFYRGLITGMPSIIYNPITLNSIHVPFNVLPESLYINYKLTPHQKKIVHTLCGVHYFWQPKNELFTIFCKIFDIF